MKEKTILKTFLNVLKLCAMGALVGLLGGALGAAFAHLLTFVTELRHTAPWLILLLPLGGIVTVLLYRAFHMEDHRGANEIVLCLAEGKPIRTAAAPLIFVSGAVTHLLGGSAGREGAALQLGGAGAAALCRFLPLREEGRRIVTMCGMSAVFAGLFGTPLTAAAFVLEFKAKPKLLLKAGLPCVISSVIAAKVASFLAVASEAVPLEHIASFSLPSLAGVLLLALGLSILGRVLCFAFHNAGRWAKKFLPNPFLRTILPSLAVVCLTILVGDMRYNGSGMPLAHAAVEGHAAGFDFLWKLLFTALTLAAGLKGGEIVPTFCIGATFGCVFGGILGLDPGFAAALGLVGLFSCAAGSPLGGIFLGIELFGFGALPWYILLCLVLWPLSVKDGLFQERAFRPVALPGRK